MAVLVAMGYGSNLLSSKKLIKDTENEVLSKYPFAKVTIVYVETAVPYFVKVESVWKEPIQKTGTKVFYNDGSSHKYVICFFGLRVLNVRSGGSARYYEL